MSFKEHFGIEDSLIPRLATGFGAGIGRKGSLCGAYAGSVMAIGMRSGRTDSSDKDCREKTYDACYRFWDRFEKEFGSCYCYDLIECHLDNEEERRKWLAGGGMETCANIVERTAQLLLEFIEEMG